MTAYYPEQIKTFVTRVNFTDTILAEHVNSLQDEVNAIETILGTYIHVSNGWVGVFDEVTTTWTTLEDRLVNMEYGIGDTRLKILPSGGTTGQVLIKSTNDDYEVEWSTGDFLPSQTGNDTKFLTTDGSSASWADLPAGETFNPLFLIGA